MTNPVDHDAVQAAQALCMLAVDTRQQSVDPDKTEDEQDCVITHVRRVVRPVVRPVVHRHHPYRRPEPQRVGVPAARSRGMSPNVEAERLARERAYLHRDNWNVFPLEQHEMQPGAPVPEVRRVIRNGVAVLEKVPLPHTQPSVVQRSTPVEHPTPARRPLPDQRPSPFQKPPPGGRPSPSQPPTPAGDDADPDVNYSYRALALQALLAAPEGEWVSTSDMADHIEERYPPFRETEASRRLRRFLCSALTGVADLLEKSAMRDTTKAKQWRVPSWARKTAAILAWTKQPPASLQRPSMPYAPKSLMLQALLASPEGQWMLVTELVGHLLSRYPQLLGLDTRNFSGQISGALNHASDLVEKAKLHNGPHGVFWRLLPGVRAEAVRLAWPNRPVQNATH